MVTEWLEDKDDPRKFIHRHFQLLGGSQRKKSITEDTPDLMKAAKQSLEIPRPIIGTGWV